MARDAADRQMESTVNSTRERNHRHITFKGGKFSSENEKRMAMKMPLMRNNPAPKGIIVKSSRDLKTGCYSATWSDSHGRK